MQSEAGIRILLNTEKLLRDRLSPQEFWRPDRVINMNLEGGQKCSVNCLLLESLPGVTPEDIF